MNSLQKATKKSSGPIRHVEFGLALPAREALPALLTASRCAAGTAAEAAVDGQGRLPGAEIARPQQWLQRIRLLVLSQLQERAARGTLHALGARQALQIHLDPELRHSRRRS